MRNNRDKPARVADRDTRKARKNALGDGRLGKPTRGVRPTTAKVLESLLGILAPHLEDARAMDLFAGTGQVGLSFLERGARSVQFVEAVSEVARSLQSRLRAEAEVEQASLCRGKIPAVLQTLQGPFDLFWADPPYDWEGYATLLPALAPLAGSEAIAVVEHHHKTPYAECAGWKLYRRRDFGETRLSFYRMAMKRRLFVDPSDEEVDDGD